MMDLISVGAISAVLAAVGTGTASEVGRRVAETAGGLVRRIVGREVAAPTTPGQRDAVARLVHERAQADPQLAAEWLMFARGVPAPRAVRPSARPCLPTAPRFFTDRQQAMKLLDKEASRPHDGRPRLAQLHGPEGIGTTTLACHWGWRQTARFPDGQLYADLGTLPPEVVLGTLLRQLGLPDDEIPPATHDRADFFRECLAERRVLLVLDHVESAAQVQPLLSSAPDVFTIVVARRPLVGLGALQIPIGPLARRDAMQMLRNLVGEPAVNAARPTLPGVLDRCAGLPYALHAAALSLTVPPELPEDNAVPESDPVHAAAEDSYRRLTPGAARLYRLTGLRDWPALDTTAAAHAADLDRSEAAAHLEELAEALLVERTDAGRYRYRPALRSHAERKAAAVDGIGPCSAAVARVIAGYRDLAVGAAQAALPQSWRVPSARSPVSYPDPGTAVAALAAEAPNLVEAVHAAEEFGDRDTATLLCRALWPLQLKVGHHDVLLPALRAGVQIADDHFPGTLTAGALHFQLAHCLMELSRWAEAEPESLAAAREEQVAGHARGHASAVELRGLLRMREWRFEEAYACFEEAARVYDTIGPGDEGSNDLPRARALLARHRGRALGHLGRRAEAVEHLNRALRFFRDSGEAYNTARTLTDLAETHLDGGAPGTALPLIDEALAALQQERADHHVAWLRTLRERCLRAE
ncbi:tetratricopeptide repeat protein [Streptomyces sp. NBC_00287]|uniref:tetratricopeptide repeat protein n=1 Tax=Streptomyces sp. NBC_00287 TaxID=2975702 RepID=UPI002E2DA76E|nr:tetratricopeptide repeat protein [Streptomyces sp. NBC_00287]